jgi:hypothetical protein
LKKRWHADFRNGKHVVVVVVSESAAGRHWIITAYIARKLAEGELEWGREADIFHIDKCPPYAGQESEELGDDVIGAGGRFKQLWDESP